MKLSRVQPTLQKLIAHFDQALVTVLGWLVFIILRIMRLLAVLLRPLAKPGAAWFGHGVRVFMRWLKPELALLFENLRWSGTFGLASLGIAALALSIWYTQGNFATIFMVEDKDALLLGHRAAVHAAQPVLALAMVTALAAAVASLLAFTRMRVGYWILRSAAGLNALMLVLLAGTCLRVLSILHLVDGTHFSRDVQNHLMLNALRWMVPGAVLGGVYLVLLGLNTAKRYYGCAVREESGLGDRIWRNVCTHGDDPKFRKSFYLSTAGHLFIVFGIPFLIAMHGCRQQPYAIPKGTGSPVIQSVKLTGPTQATRSARRKVDLNTAVSTFAPTIDESDIIDQIDEQTADTYEAAQAEASGLGAGGGGKGGWPDGMENAKVRFIRLQYDGGDWDLDMGFGSDYNMLIKFRQLTGFNVWPKTESIRIADLMRFPKNRAPPFVYMYGGLKGSINVSQAESKIIRKYCLDMGGMIFADNGGNNFDRGFRSLVQRVFPDLALVDIASDDVIYRQPFLFPDGAPPLWHHSGNRALGVKYKGRWVVFYHQGDMGDAWKDGHSGASDGLAMQAYKLGVNVMNYAFNQYMELNFPTKGKK